MTATHHARRERARRSRGLALRLVTLGTAAFGAVAVIYVLSTQTSRGQRAENALLGARRRELRSGADVPVEILATISVWSLVATIAAVMLVALARGRPRLALGAGAVIGGSIMTTEVLKKVVLPRPPLDPQAPPWLLNNIFPSGHTTIAVAAAVAFVLVVPQRLRGPAALAGGFYAAAIAATTLEAGWHRTSDALGATFLVLGAALWACGLLVLWRGTGRPAERGPTWPSVILVAVATLGGLVNIVGIPRVLRAVDRGPLDSAGVDEAYAVSLALVALAIASAMAVLLLALRGVSLDSPSADADADADAPVDDATSARRSGVRPGSHDRD